MAASVSLTGWQEALALGTPHFAANAPELAPLAGLAGQDMAAGNLVIEGHLPAGLRGTYYRNGPRLLARGGERYRHWFDGDGLLQAWTFGEQGVSHQARFVQTDKFRAESQAGRFMLPGFGTSWVKGTAPRLPVRGPDSMNAANTSVLRQGKRLYALWEGGSAYELDPISLATRGQRVWSPELTGMPFSAHPRVEADGTVWNFGTVPGRLAIYQLSANGEVLRSEVFAAPGPSAMAHDFAVSQRFLVFLLPPLQMDIQALHDGDSLLDAMRWRGEDPTRVLIIDKADLSCRRGLEMPAAMVFHFGNAWDDGDLLQLDYVQAPPLPAFNAEVQQIMRGERPVQRQPSTACFLRVDLRSRRIELQSHDESVEFPVVDPCIVAQRYRHVYYPTVVDIGQRWGFNGLLHLDIETGRQERFSFGHEVVVEEHVLVSKPGSRREVAGWLLGVCYDSRRQRSFASLFDAQALSAGPLAKVCLPYWVPYGFHGKFY